MSKRYWVQFLQQSTGYVEGSIPPRFEESAKRLIDAPGSDGVFILDGRNSAETMRRDALKRAQRLEHWKRFAGFQIVTGPRLFEETRRGPIHTLSYPVQA